MNATATIQIKQVKGLQKIQLAAKNHHLGLKKYCEQRLPRAEIAAKNSHTPGMVSWWRNYAKKLRLVIKAL